MTENLFNWNACHLILFSFSRMFLCVCSKSAEDLYLEMIIWTTQQKQPRDIIMTVLRWRSDDYVVPPILISNKTNKLSGFIWMVINVIINVQLSHHNLLCSFLLRLLLVALPSLLCSGCVTVCIGRKCFNK